MVQGDIQSWVKQDFRVKEFQPEATLTIFYEEDHEIRRHVVAPGRGLRRLLHGSYCGRYRLGQEFGFRQEDQSLG